MLVNDAKVKMRKGPSSVDHLKRRSQTVNMILDNASKLFGRHGYERTSMRDLANACGFESPNFYNYFKNKEQVLYEVLKRELDLAITQIKPLADDKATSPSESLRLLIRKTLEVNLVSGGEMGVLFDAELKSLSSRHRKKIVEYRDIYEETLSKILMAGVDSGDFVIQDPKVVCYSIASAILRTRVWFSPKGRLSPDEIADSMCSFILNGIMSR